MKNKYINKVKVVEDENETYVVKKETKKLETLYEYLNQKGFTNFPQILSKDERGTKYEYIEEISELGDAREKEFIKTVSSLHYRTSFHKDVSKHKYREVYETISDNIEYLQRYYDKTIAMIENEVYMSPSHYLIARNYSIIVSSLSYARNELKKWFKLVENKTKERVCILHNNLSDKHFIRGEKNCLVSFDNYLVDTPVLDLYKLYKREGLKYDFPTLLKDYEREMKLSEEERILLFTLISIPKKIEEIDHEYENTKNIKNIFAFLYKGSAIIDAYKE